MNSLERHLLSPETAVDSILAQISYVALLAYLNFNLGKLAFGGKKLRSTVIEDCLCLSVYYGKVYVVWVFLGCFFFLIRVLSTGALRVTGLRLFPLQLMVILYN